MQTFKTAVLATSLVALAGCAELGSFLDRLRDNTCLRMEGWYGYMQEPCSSVPVKTTAAAPSELADELFAAQQENGTLRRRVSDLERRLADRDREIASLRAQLSSTQRELDLAKRRIGDLEKSLAAAGAGAAGSQLASSERDKLSAELAAANRRIADLENQLADRDRELAALRGDLSDELAKLKEAQRGLIRALRPEIEKGDITVDLNNERLLINLASSYLFGSGEDQLKPAGTDALKQVGTILKGYPEYKVAVDGHTDNRPIRSALKKKFPTNQELSEARAANAAKALTEGGLGAVTTRGFADTKPVAPNTTEAGRAKNRRVEVIVTR